MESTETVGKREWDKGRIKEQGSGRGERRLRRIRQTSSRCTGGRWLAFNGFLQDCFLS